MNNLPVGTKLQGGTYTVGKVLGQGGFGVIYVGSDTNLRRMVAIKEFFPEGCIRQGNVIQPSGAMPVANYQRAKEKFREEAEALARFHHPNIVAVHSVFEESNTAYMVMQYLEGKTLQELVEERGALPEREAVGYIEQIGQALEAVHGVNLIHSDINPSNVIVCNDGRVVVIDFGLNRKLEEASGYGTRRLTSDTFYGTGGYAPLEQYAKQVRLGPYTDIYALGATLYFLLTGEVPVEATLRASGEDIPQPRQLNSKITCALSDAVMCAMELRGNQRPQNVRAFLNTLTGKTVITPSHSSPSTQRAAPTLLRTLTWRTDYVSSVAFSPDGRYIACGGSEVRLLDGLNGLNETHLWERRGGYVAFSPTGQIIASVGAGMNLWLVETGDLLWSDEWYARNARAAAFSLNGKILASADEGGVTLWDVETKGEVRSSLMGHGHHVNSVAFSPNGKMV